MNNKITGSLLFILLWLVFQLAFSSGQYYLNQDKISRFTSSIEKRIALDLPKLKLANPRFRTVTHESSVKEYLNNLNYNLEQLKSPIKVSGLQEVTISTFSEDHKHIPRELRTTDQNIPLTLVETVPNVFSQFTFLAPFLAGVFLFFGYRHYVADQIHIKEQSALPEETREAKLVVDLHNKTIGNGMDSKVMPLSNKPFCFYVALVDYCLQHDTPSLNHNKDVPDEILHLANKYFYRLIELGHTKRKKPDFSTNLDKTLSEIRSTLDEVFHDYADAKDRFSPPKAQGEGSRSKIHNYALPHILTEQVEFIGK